MRRALERICRGRLTVWWWTHRQDSRTVVLASTLLGIIGLQAYFDHQDLINNHDLMVAQTATLRREREMLERLPPVLFLIESRTVAGASYALARVAGTLDTERYTLTTRK